MSLLSRVLVRILFVCLGFIVPLENFSLTWRRHHCRWRAANFDLCSAPMPIEQWGFFSVPHLLCHRHPAIMVISKDPWHSHLHVLPSVWQWSCHYLSLDWGPSRLGFEHPITLVRTDVSENCKCMSRPGTMHVRERYVSRYLFIHVHMYMIFTAISHKLQLPWKVGIPNYQRL